MKKAVDAAGRLHTGQDANTSLTDQWQQLHTSSFIWQLTRPLCISVISQGPDSHVTWYSICGIKGRRFE